MSKTTVTKLRSASNATANLAILAPAARACTVDDVEALQTHVEELQISLGTAFALVHHVHVSDLDDNLAGPCSHGAELAIKAALAASDRLMGHLISMQ